MTAPLVSVIIPTYNRAEMVARATRSVVAQTFPDWELIVVDDGSTDNTEAVVNSFADRRVVYLRREKNGGVNAARNSGISAARGRYVSFLDSDDEYLPGKLGRQVDLLSKRDHEVDGVECAARVMEVDHEWTMHPPLRGTDYDQLLDRMGRDIHVSLLLLRRELADAIRFDESFPAWGDVDFLLRLLKRCRLAFIDEPLVVLHRHAGLHLSTVAARLNGLRRGFQKYGTELETRYRLRGLWHFRMAGFCMRLGDVEGARRELLSSVRAWPWNPIRWLLIVGMLSGSRSFSGVHWIYALLSRMKRRARRALARRG